MIKGVRGTQLIYQIKKYNLLASKIHSYIELSLCHSLVRYQCYCAVAYFRCPTTDEQSIATSTHDSSFIIHYSVFITHYSLLTNMRRKHIIALIRKDITLELRQQQNLYGILVYAASTIFVLYLAAGRPDAVSWNALFWVTQLFIVVNAVVKSFVGEPRGRELYHYTLVHPLEYLCSKMLLNIIYMAVLSLVAMTLFRVLLGDPVSNSWRFLGIVVLGGVGLSLVFTMLSAIASKARQQASLIAILGFPVIIPQLVLLVRLSKTAYGEVFKSGAVLQLTGLLIGLDILVVVMALVLFPYLWKD